MTDVIRGSIWRVYIWHIEFMSHTGFRFTRIPNGFMILALNKTSLPKFKRNFVTEVWWTKANTRVVYGEENGRITLR
jgi:hypothetical protein